MFFRAVVFLFLVLTSACALAEEIELIADGGGTYSVPVILNETLKLNFTLDSGASGVHITPDVWMTLLRSGTVSKDDILEESRTYVLADGSTVKASVVNIKEIRVGSVVVKNVEVSISHNYESSLLLGQSFLSRLPRWSIDNSKNVLILEPEQEPITIETFWREGDEFSIQAGSDWRVAEPDADTETFALNLTDGDALIRVMEIEQESGTDKLARMVQDALSVHQAWKSGDFMSTRPSREKPFQPCSAALKMTISTSSPGPSATEAGAM